MHRSPMANDLRPKLFRKNCFRTSRWGSWVNRCVRRSFLCGTDQVSGKNYDHRKQWIQDRLQFLAGQFGIDILGFAVMSNHIHVILRNRPDVVKNWTDADVARRWWNMFPMRRDKDRNPQEPTEIELQIESQRGATHNATAVWRENSGLTATATSRRPCRFGALSKWVARSCLVGSTELRLQGNDDCRP